VSEERTQAATAPSQPGREDHEAHDDEDLVEALEELEGLVAGRRPFARGAAAVRERGEVAACASDRKPAATAARRSSG
jgi:hypothetical protein